jgi:hypothetical protein
MYNNNITSSTATYSPFEGKHPPITGTRSSTLQHWIDGWKGRDWIPKGNRDLGNIDGRLNERKGEG